MDSRFQRSGGAWLRLTSRAPMEPRIYLREPRPERREQRTSMGALRRPRRRDPGQADERRSQPWPCSTRKVPVLLLEWKSRRSKREEPRPGNEKLSAATPASTASPCRNAADDNSSGHAQLPPCAPSARGGTCLRGECGVSFPKHGAGRAAPKHSGGVRTPLTVVGPFV